jgi:hypothetical protein
MGVTSAVPSLTNDDLSTGMGRPFLRAAARIHGGETMRADTRSRVAVVVAIVGIAWIAAAFALRGAAGPAGAKAKRCDNPQSPRKLEHYDHNSKVSIVRQGPNDTVLYTPRDQPKAQPITLRRCSQHYHCQVENTQPQCGEQGAVAPAAAASSPYCPMPPARSWVEIHTAYSFQAECVAEGLECCTKQPVVVIAYHAKLTDGGLGGPVPVPWGPPSAEWSGSSTGVKPPLECKGPAQWAFTLGCGFTVTKRQLEQFRYPERARPLQDQLSTDFTLVEPR